MLIRGLLASHKFTTTKSCKIQVLATIIMQHVSKFSFHWHISLSRPLSLSLSLSIYLSLYLSLSRSLSLHCRHNQVTTSSRAYLQRTRNSLTRTICYFTFWFSAPRSIGSCTVYHRLVEKTSAHKAPHHHHLTLPMDFIPHNTLARSLQSAGIGSINAKILLAVTTFPFLKAVTIPTSGFSR